jgi:SAM-dependent methyltransferase
MLLPLPENERWVQWEEKQALGLTEYESPDPDYKAYYDQIAAEFGAFCQLTGAILDVGCGIEREPAYAIRPPGSKYVGVDPFIAEQARAFDFVQGLGEWLPFRAESFDQAICATSLDHFPDPSRVLSEIRRVLKPSGCLCLWVGVLNPEYLLETFEGTSYRLGDLAGRDHRRELLGRVRGRKVRELPVLAWRHLVLRPMRALVGRIRMRFDEAGFVESVSGERSKYHFHFFKAEEVAELVTRSGYEIVKRRLIKDRIHGDSLFLQAAPSRKG